MRPRTATIGSVSFNVSKKKSLPWGPHAAGAGSSLDHTEEGRDSPTTPTRKTSLFDSFRPRSKSDATRKLSHRRVPMVRPDFFKEDIYPVRDIKKTKPRIPQFSNSRISSAA